MSKVRPPWQEELAIIDRTMKAISGVTDPEELVGIYWDGINQLTRSYTRAGTFVTAFYAVLDPSSSTLTYSRAGHNPPRLVRDGQVHALDECGALPLGILLAQTYDQSTVTLSDGDLLLLYTDGITETMAPRTAADDGEIFGIERLDRVLLDGAARSAEEWIARIRAALAAFSGNAPPIDDQTLIAVWRRP